MLTMNIAVKRCCSHSHLPSEIIEWEILTRLPVKSILRFKLVCKSWNLLISRNPEFIKSHLVLNHNDSLIYKCAERIKHAHDQDSLFQWYTQIIGSINGLVCFFNWHYDEHEGIKIGIWNPATKQCLTDIPPLPDTCVDRDIDIDDFFGFGFDSVANDYKVVYVITTEEQPLVGDIYSCNRRRWMKTSPSDFLFRGSVPLKTQPVISRGSSYWLNRQPNGENLRLSVIWFDVGNEIFKMLPGSIDKKQGKACVLINLRDSVGVMIYDFTLFLTEPTDIYVFDERCSDWSRTSIEPLIGKGPLWGRPLIGKGTLSVHTFILCYKNDDILFSSCDLELCCINLQTHAIKRLAKDRKSRSIVFGYSYSESLVFLEGMMHLKEKEIDVGIFFLNK